MTYFTSVLIKVIEWEGWKSYIVAFCLRVFGSSASRRHSPPCWTSQKWSPKVSDIDVDVENGVAGVTLTMELWVWCCLWCLVCYWCWFFLSQICSPWSRIRNISGQSSWTGYLRWGKSVIHFETETIFPNQIEMICCPKRNQSFVIIQHFGYQFIRLDLMPKDVLTFKIWSRRISAEWKAQISITGTEMKWSNYIWSCF